MNRNWKIVVDLKPQQSSNSLYFKTPFHQISSVSQMNEDFFYTYVSKIIYGKCTKFVQQIYE